MENKNVETLKRAIAEHGFDGRFSIGTAAIVEALHTDLGHSYEQIANIADVSTAGVRRWRERNVGDKSRFEVLLRYAESIVNGTASGKEAASAASPANGASAGQQQDALRETGPTRPLSIVEAKLGLAMMFGVDPSQIEIHIKG